MKILVVSDLNIYALAHSYIKAFKELNHQVETFDPYPVINKYVKFNKLGRKLHAFLPVEAWTRKGNRELAVRFQQYRPDLVMIFGNAPVLYGTLAFIKSVSDCKTIIYWPDTLTNLDQNQLNGARLYDAVATYSSATMPVFERIGFPSAIFLPFAGDIEFLGGPVAGQADYLYDISFAGGWRPERERALTKIFDAFPDKKIRVGGTNWKERCQDKRLLNNFLPPMFGKAFGDFFRQSRINLNVIDDTNFPAANMRFFEVPAAGGLQLSSSCPEQEGIFRDQESILYFRNEVEMIEKIRLVFNQPELAGSIRAEGHRLVKTSHTYVERARLLVERVLNSEFRIPDSTYQ